MKPWLLATLLTLNEFAAQGYLPELAVDVYLSDFARAQKKPVVELESARDQLALFDALPLSDQIRFLEETVTEIEDRSALKKMTRLTRLWREADRAGLERLAEELTHDRSFSGQFFQRALLDGRNPGLADGMEKLLASERDAFAGIGILHLTGAGSVPALLRRRGYLVERIY